MYFIAVLGLMTVSGILVSCDTISIFVPKDKKLHDGVHLNMDFEPRFRANLEDGTDEEVEGSEPL